ncbi:MAG: nitroreductase/quinone reductase family protein, partial [Pseudomonadota bacterium]
MNLIHKSLLNTAMALSSTRIGGVVATTLLAPLDRWLLRRSRGQHSIAGLGVPTLLLTTEGRISGEPRQTPLLYLWDEDRYLVVGSRGGRPGHAQWYLNLRRNPTVRVLVDGEELVCQAEQLERSSTKTGADPSRTRCSLPSRTPRPRRWCCWRGARLRRSTP